MNFEAVISLLYKDAEVNDCINKLVPKHHLEDFKQELFIRLIEYKDSVLAAYQAGRHKFYTLRVILSLVRRERDIYHKKYKLRETVDLPDMSEYCEPSDFEIRKIKEEDEIKLIDRVKNLEELTGTCYYRLLVAALEKHGSYREVSRQTGIPITSISNAMKKIRQILKDE